MRVSYTLPSYGFDGVKREIEKLNKKAIKLGLKPIEIDIINEYEHEFIDYAEERYRDPMMIGTVNAKDVTKTTTMYEVEITGEDPLIKGWKFMAIIEHGRDGKNILSGIEDVPEKYRTADSNCDHCKQDRYRVKTYILFNGKEHKQVGSTCLKDFLGHTNPHELAAYSESLFSCFSKMSIVVAEFNEGEFYEGGGGDYHSLNMIVFLDVVAASIRGRGWVSATTARDTGKLSTAHHALDIIFNNIDEYEMKDKELYVKEEDRERVKGALVWIEDKSGDTNLNDYMWNLTTLCGRERINPKHVGIAASLIYTYNREREKVIAVGTDKSEWQGTVGEKLTVTVKTANVMETEGYYGVTYLCKMIDDNSNLFVWFASSKKMDVGKTYEITGKVKKHDIFNGAKQTVLTRCKVKETSLSS